MKALYFALACALSTSVPGLSLAGDKAPVYPETARGPDVDIMHGVEVADPYRWLEDMDDNVTLGWAAAQTKVTQDYLSGPERDEIHARLAELTELDSFPASAAGGARSFVASAPFGTGYADIMVKDQPDADFRTIVRASTQASDGNSFRISRLWPSADGTRLAYTGSLGGSSWRQVTVIDVDSGEVLGDDAPGLHSLNGQIVWQPDGQGYYYVGWEHDGEGQDARAPATNGRVYHHRLGTGADADVMVFDSLGPKWVYAVAITGDARYMVIHAREGASPISRFFIKDLRQENAAFVPWFADRTGDYAFLGSKGSRLFFYTDLDAKNGRVVAIDAAGSSGQQLQEVIAEAEEAMFAGSLVGGNAIGMFADRIVLTYSFAGVSVVKVFDPEGAYQYTLDLPTGYTIWGGFSGTPDHRKVDMYTLNPYTPGQVFSFDIHSGDLTLVAGAKGGLDPSAYTAEQVFYKSEDGTSVPMMLSYKKGLKRDGTSPTFMYAYGAYGWVSFLFYQPHMALWMEQGGIYAIPGIRGGGEYGPEWREAGRAQNKTNTVADYIAAAKWLVSENYTRPELLIANGGSASGFLPATAMIQEPELFGGAVIDIPILDLMRLEKFGNGSFVKAEYGSPEIADEFSILRQLSPYHTLKEGACYPPTIVMVGENDNSAVPAHGYKFAAALQHAQGCSAPTLLNVMPGAGHNYGNTAKQNIESRIDQILFVLKAIKRGQPEMAR